MSIYNTRESIGSQEVFKPTWLYIKRHNTTGLMYFGKTTQKDPVKYKGSGTYWNRHLLVHGNNVSTVWCQLFTDPQLLINYAIQFSTNNNIVESKLWANLKIENGLDGGRAGLPHTPETKIKLSEGKLGSKNPMFGKPSPFLRQTHTPETKEHIKYMRAKQVISDETKKKMGRPRSEEFKQNLSQIHSGKKLSEETKQRMRKPKSEEAKQNMRIARQKYLATRS